jgi:hypothetical protein
MSFVTYKTEDDLEPIEVELGPENGKKESFTFAPMIPGMLLLDYMDGLADEGDLKAMSDILRRFLFEAVVPKDKNRLDKYLRNPDNMVGFTALMDITEGLFEEYSGGVPTQPEQSSSNGSAPSGSSATDKPSRKA